MNSITLDTNSIIDIENDDTNKKYYEYLKKLHDTESEKLQAEIEQFLEIVRPKITN